MMEIKFVHPWWLATIPLMLGVAYLLYRRADIRRRNALAQFASPQLLPGLTSSVSIVRRRNKRLLWTASLVLGVIALSRPQWGFRWKEVQRKGIDILIAIDTSKSMLAEDVKPNRLTRAKLAVSDLLEKLDGDRIGLIAFAGSSFLQCPLTLDYDAFRQSLDALDVNIIPRGGTNLASAMEEAERTFQMGNPNHRVLILLTDGEDLEASGIETARKAAKDGVHVFTVGVGTAGGELIPIHAPSGELAFVKDASGQPVKSRLDETTLRQISEITGAFYTPLGQQNEGFNVIYEQGLAPIPKQDLFSRMNKVYIERFQWPLAFAVVCLMLEYLMSDRKRGSSSPGWRQAFRLPWKRAGIVPLVLLLMNVGGFPAWASPSSAERAYQQNRFDESLEQYKRVLEKHPARPDFQFNVGTAAFKAGKYAEAERAFEQALKTDQTGLQELAFYNLGNTQYRLGQQTSETDKKHTLQEWQSALQSYERCLKLKPSNEDARFNYNFVKRKLEELQQKEPHSSPEQENSRNQDSPKNESGDPRESSQKKPQEKQKQNEPDSSRSKDGKPRAGESGMDPKSGDPAKRDPEKQKQASGGNNQNGEKQESKEKGQALQIQPGEISKDDAERLLDSLRSEESKYPVILQEQHEETPVRDW